MSPGDPSPIRTGSGYVVDLDAWSLDAVRFEDMVAEARRSKRSGDAAAAAATLLEAGRSWRGEVLADFPDSAFAEGVGPDHPAALR